MEEKKKKPEVAENLKDVSLEDLYKRRQEIYDSGLGDIEKAIHILEHNKLREGKAVDTIDELVCPAHSGSKFIKHSDIKGSYNSLTSEKLHFYACEECAKDGGADPKFLMGVAYECQNCGLVEGTPHSERYDDRGPLCGGTGRRYICEICHDELGRETFSHC